MAQIFLTDRYFRKLSVLTLWWRKKGRILQRGDAEIVRLSPRIVRRGLLESTSLSTTLVMKPSAPLMRIPVLPGVGNRVHITIPPEKAAEPPRSVSVERVVGLVLPRIVQRAEEIEKLASTLPYDTPAMGELKKEIHFLKTLHAALGYSLDPARVG